MKMKNISKETYLIEGAKFGGMLFYLFIIIFVALINPNTVSSNSSILLSGLSRFISGYIAITLLYLILNFQSNRNLKSQKIFIFLLVPISYITAVVWFVFHISLYNLIHSDPLFFSTFYLLKAVNFFFIVI
ncbi:MAG: hypothetical protein KAS62_07820, partial [Candidatus Delongbacteria bacterium]|nr:hypothetical protein [Candidatus Delongbacteria bacterium]